jgi:hypothetical protein
MSTARLPLGYLMPAAGGSVALYAFSVWLPIHHRGGIGRPVWLVFDAPAGDVTAALEGAAFVMQRPAGRWVQIPADLGGELGAKLREVVDRKWIEARLAMN